ncbi:hypothetical protein GQ42DRAFT_169050, partial [Ramicandelaber brevisporus]
LKESSEDGGTCDDTSSKASSRDGDVGHSGVVLADRAEHRGNRLNVLVKVGNEAGGKSLWISSSLLVACINSSNSTSNVSQISRRGGSGDPSFGELESRFQKRLNLTHLVRWEKCNHLSLDGLKIVQDRGEVSLNRVWLGLVNSLWDSWSGILSRDGGSGEGGGDEEGSETHVFQLERKRRRMRKILWTKKTR